MAQDTIEKFTFEVRFSSEQPKTEMEKVRTQERGLTTDTEPKPHGPAKKP